MASRILDNGCLLAGVALALLTLSPAYAQLRGSVPENAARSSVLDNSALVRRPSTQPDTASDGLPIPTYRPASRGATSDENDEDGAPSSSGIFNQRDPDDPFATLDGRRSSARPASARERAAEASRQAGARPGTAAERQASEAGSRRAGPNERDEITTATLADAPRDVVDPGRRLPVEQAAGRIASLTGSTIAAEDDPYAPLGLRLGTFNVTTTLDQLVGHSSNPDFWPNGRGATISETDLRLSAVSDWARHAARVDAYGTYRRSISGTEVEDREAGISGILNLEIGDSWGATLGAGYSMRPESASSPVEIVGALSRPLRHTFTGRAGIEKTEGKLRLGLTADVERAVFGDADIAGGGTLSQEDRNYTLATARLRAGYEISPALVPFAELEAGRRLYDLKADAAGYERSANRLGFRGGTAFDFGEKLSGEFAVGWLRESLDDPRLTDVSGLTADGSIQWSPQRGTLLRLLGYTAIEGTTTAGQSGSILYSGTASVERQLRANLTGTASIGAYYRDYVGTNGYDRGLIGEASATWWFNRYAGLIGRARYETQESNLPGRGADVASVFAGIRLQR